MKSMADKAETVYLAIKDMKGSSWLVAFVADGGFLATSRSCTW